MLAHAESLRVEAEDDAQVEAIKTDYHQADLSPADRCLCDLAVKLTRSPAAVSPADLDALRSCGFDDRAIHDAVQVTAYFNYINRIADGLGVDLEPEMPPR